MGSSSIWVITHTLPACNCRAIRVATLRPLDQTDPFQARASVIRPGDHVRLVEPLKERDDGTEGLLCYDSGVLRGLVDDGRLDEVANFLLPVTQTPNRDDPEHNVATTMESKTILMNITRAIVEATHSIPLEPSTPVNITSQTPILATFVLFDLMVYNSKHSVTETNQQ
ncbi:hypothetical protein PV10_01153 [Exophiala mesophila]|uniref:Uncharacterized protein n=1 Tax=Exophiala mesophila TaxID=212818 RepID=A0A0D2AEQ4_EXOME|nr:uncharacterized protein PV10_01153 [Exophiala mesophila]KIV97398.1 hypothetical protein PV10_01153 [Exophiala mesophila]